MSENFKYLSIPVHRPKVAVFGLAACAGCQLQLLNKEETLFDFLSLMELVDFRMAMTDRSDDYEIAFVEGSLTRADEVKTLKQIRQKAKTLVALGTCACFGGVNQLKNRFRDIAWIKKEVYASNPIETEAARPLSDCVTVDLEIYGCPVKKEEVEKTVINIVLGKSIIHPKYPVCMECKANGNICLFDLGEVCLGPVTRAGCNSWCPNSKYGCWGCRGPADNANLEQIKHVMKEHGFTMETLLDRLECFGGFASQARDVRSELNEEARGKSV